MVKNDLFKEMIKSQIELNNLTHSNWKNSNLDWSRAIMDEISEALNSFDWKWWKKGELDKENLIVELIDIIHFSISSTFCLCNKSKVDGSEEDIIDEIVSKVNNFYKETETVYYSESHNREKFVENMLLKHFSINYIKVYPDEFISKVIFMLECLGLSFDDIYRKYMIKNTLNIFRMNNGYAKGSYIKKWKVSDISFKEDNEIAMHYGNGFVVDKNFKNNLYKILEDVYKSFTNCHKH